MSWSKITMIGMESYLNYQGKSLFDDVTMPDGIDFDTLKGNILLEGGEFEVLYSNPDFMRDCVTKWGKKYYQTFKKWIDALNFEYEPLWNFDRHEEWSEDIAGDNTTTYGKKDTRIVESDTKQTNDLKENVDIDDEVENKRSAMDSSSYQPHDQILTDSGQETRNTGTIKNELDTTDTNTESGSDKNEHNTQTTHTGHLYGNIGVTTSQQMLESELELRKWNIYEHITDLFIKDLLIPVYD